MKLMMRTSCRIPFEPLTFDLDSRGRPSVVFTETRKACSFVHTS